MKTETEAKQKQKPPITKVEVAVANICPHTKTHCINSCLLPTGTGKVYCLRWIEDAKQGRIKDEIGPAKNTASSGKSSTS